MDRGDCQAIVHEIAESGMTERLTHFCFALILKSYSVYSCHLFLISSASVRSITFLPFIDPIFA